jgi:hypothetical protein
MEQSVQKNQENKLPKKTRIAAWWMIIISGLGILFGIYLAIFSKNMIYIPAIPILLFLGVIFLLPAILLLIVKKRIIWLINIFILTLFLLLVSVPAVVGRSIPDLFFLIIFVPPWLLLIGDSRKSF